MRGSFLALSVWSCLAGIAAAASSDDTLRYYLAKAPVCVAGRITSEPTAESKEAGVVHYRFEFEVSDVLAGQAGGPRAFPVAIVRLETGEADRLPYLEKGTECILFLKRPAADGAPWETVDHWFGIQHSSPSLAGALKRVAGEAKPVPATVKPAPRPALNLVEHAPRLAGRWLLTLPAGFKYEAVLRRTDEQHFQLEKAVRFSGEYELRDNRLVFIKGTDAMAVGFAWELHAPDELTLVAQRPNIGPNYLGATLKQVSREEPAPTPARTAAGVPGAMAAPTEQAAAPARYSLFFLATVLILAQVVLTVAVGMWLALRQRRGEEEPSAENAVEHASRPEATAPRTTVTCPGCAKVLKTRVEQAGKKVKCPECGEVVPVPQVAAGRAERSSG